jgi:conjugal transfer pilus assembly protein TraU
MKTLKLFIAFALIFSVSLAEAKCVGRFINPITEVCWSCIFPISIGGTKLKGSHNRDDTANPKSPICACPKNGVPIPVPGITLGFWEPIGLIDVTRTPYCMVSIGGFQMMKDHKKQGGVEETAAIKGLQNSFYHLHYYKFPILWILELVTDLAVCLEQSKADIAYLTEFDPSWQNSALANLLSPENIMFNNPTKTAMCAVDCTKSINGVGDDKLHWCAGCNGGLFPAVGRVAYHRNGLHASTLLSSRLISKLHRQGMFPITSTDNIKKICKMGTSLGDLTLKKSQYKLQLSYPRANAKGKYACNPLGRGEIFWSSRKSFPIKGEDFGYVLWRKRNCCMW